MGSHKCCKAGGPGAPCPGLASSLVDRASGGCGAKAPGRVPAHPAHGERRRSESVVQTRCAGVNGTHGLLQDTGDASLW